MKVVENSESIAVPLEAIISKITNNGEVFIDFNQEIIDPHTIYT
jgi:hypothetical protein